MVEIRTSEFEDGVLIRSLGQIAWDPEIALSELIANASDAGATCVRLTIPDAIGGKLEVSDNGVGLTKQQFADRWMKHGYSRSKYQGEFAEMPPSRHHVKRKSFGRNGLGRHALLCFSSRYEVETRSYLETTSNRFVIEPSSGTAVFAVTEEALTERPEPGTSVSCLVERAHVSEEVVREALAFMFLHDPEFSILVNEKEVTPESPLLIHSESIHADDLEATVEFWDVSSTKRKKTLPHGIAFWVGNRLVGQPGYELQGLRLIDGRTSVAARHLIVVKSDSIHADVLPDWSGFRRTPRIAQLGGEVGTCVDRVTRKLLSSRIEDTKKDVLREHQADLRRLKPLGQLEISEFVDCLMEEAPTLNLDTLSIAVKAALNLEKSRSGRRLLEKLAIIKPEDAEALDKLLDTWGIRDALAALDEIERRLSVVEAIEKLTGDRNADELTTIHPIMTHARWLFGPEYDSGFYASNVTIQNAARHVFRKKIDSSQIVNPRQRPDLIFLKDASLSLTGSESFDDESDLPVLRRLLLIELKRGNATIVLKHMNQTQQYVQDLLSCGLLDGTPFIHAFVVGHKVDPRQQAIKVGDGPEQARIQPCTFGQLVRCAKKRLFSLDKLLAERFRDVPGLEMVRRVLGEPQQGTLFAKQQASVGTSVGSRKSTPRRRK